MRWKCLAPHPFWDGSRGYVLRYKGTIAAFGCVMPCRFQTGTETIPACNVIDWAASKAVPSAGILLYRHIQDLTGAMINIGGTTEARQVLPKIGFDARVELQHYTRVLRPLRRFRSAAKDWKSPLRLARDYSELARRPHAETIAEVARDAVHCSRARELLAYFKGCPAARITTHEIAGGEFVLSRVADESRIADLWISSERAEDWAAAYQAALTMAGADPDVSVVSVAASLPAQSAALERCGFRRTHSEPVFVRDPAGRLAGRGGLALSLLENDAFYWRPSPATDRSK